MRRTFTAAVVAITLVLPACTMPTSSVQSPRNLSCGQGSSGGTLIGGLLGAGLGGFLGSKFGKGDGKTAMTGAGVLGGALVGTGIGRGLDAADRDCAQQASWYALERGAPGQEVAWSNPDTGNYGAVAPARVFTTPSGRVCSEFQRIAITDGMRQRTSAIACRMPDESWRIVE